MKLTTRFKKLNFWNKLGVIGAICSILSLTGWFLFRNSNPSFNLNIKNSPEHTVQTMVNSPNGIQVAGDMITKVVNNKQIQLPLKFETSIEFLRTLNRKLYNVKYILPNGKEAFIPEVAKENKYILFYTNDDLSEIYVPEKYKRVSDMTNDTCWIVTLVCKENKCGNYMELGPKAHGVASHSCYER